MDKVIQWLEAWTMVLGGRWIVMVMMLIVVMIVVMIVVVVRRQCRRNVLEWERAREVTAFLGTSCQGNLCSEQKHRCRHVSDRWHEMVNVQLLTMYNWLMSVRKSSYLSHDGRANELWIAMQQMCDADNTAAQFIACTCWYLDQGMCTEFTGSTTFHLKTKTREHNEENGIRGVRLSFSKNCV